MPPKARSLPVEIAGGRGFGGVQRRDLQHRPLPRMPGDAVRTLYERRVDAHPVMLLKVRGLRIVRPAMDIYL